MEQHALTYPSDGLEMRGELFFEPAAVPRAAVLVCPEAFGLGDNARQRARRLASIGYVALACDLHGEGRFVDDLTEALALVQPLFDNPLRTRARATAALQALSSRPEVDPGRIAAIGHCFPMSLELARAGADIKAAVGFHTVLSSAAPAQPGVIRSRILVCVGADDPFIDAPQRAAFETEMRGAGADWELQVFGRTVHSFTSHDAATRNRPEAIRYSKVADERSWASMLALFGDVLTLPGIGRRDAA